MSTTTINADRERRMAHLAHANEIRCARAKLKAQIYGGSIRAAEVILDCPPEAVSWPIGELLMAQHGCGTQRMRRLLARSTISATRPLGMLTERQRRMLARMLGYGAGEGER